MSFSDPHHFGDSDPSVHTFGEPENARGSTPMIRQGEQGPQHTIDTSTGEVTSNEGETTPGQAPRIKETENDSGEDLQPVERNSPVKVKVPRWRHFILSGSGGYIAK